MPPFRWTPEQMDRLEAAVRQNLRVAVVRRGVEFIVVAKRLATVNGKEGFVGLLPMTGEERTFTLAELDAFQVVRL
jgi:hypothetical protein